MDIGSVDSRC